MKKTFYYIFSIICALVVALTSIGLVYYTNSENNKQNLNIETLTDTKIYKLREEIKMLYMEKDKFLREKEVLLDEISKINDSSEVSPKVVTDLQSKISGIEMSITDLETRIDTIENTLLMLYSMNKNMLTCVTRTSLQINNSDSSLIPFELYAQTSELFIKFQNDYHEVITKGDSYYDDKLGETVYIEDTIDVLISGNISFSNASRGLYTFSIVDQNDKEVFSTSLYSTSEDFTLYITPILLKVKTWMQYKFLICSSSGRYCIDCTTPDSSLLNTYMTIEVII